MSRIEPTLWAQSGDWEFKNGTGGRSVYGLHFKDESHKLKHTGRGVVSMVVSRPDTSNSQFMIALDKTEWRTFVRAVRGGDQEGIWEGRGRDGTPRRRRQREDEKGRRTRPGRRRRPGDEGGMPAAAAAAVGACRIQGGYRGSWLWGVSIWSWLAVVVQTVTITHRWEWGDTAAADASRSPWPPHRRTPQSTYANRPTKD